MPRPECGKIVHVAPERLVTPGSLVCRTGGILSVCGRSALRVIVGKDFRPSHLQIPEFFAASLEKIPVGAWAHGYSESAARYLPYVRTAAAFELTTGFDRPNLYFEVQVLEEKKI